MVALFSTSIMYVQDIVYHFLTIKIFTTGEVPSFSLSLGLAAYCLNWSRLYNHFEPWWHILHCHALDAAGGNIFVIGSRDSWRFLVCHETGVVHQDSLLLTLRIALYTFRVLDFSATHASVPGRRVQQWRRWWHQMSQKPIEHGWEHPIILELHRNSLSCILVRTSVDCTVASEIGKEEYWNEPFYSTVNKASSAFVGSNLCTVGQMKMMTLETLQKFGCSP